MKNEKISTKMKDSGIEWIGEIPEEWEVVRGKSLFIQRFSKGNNIEVHLAATQQKGMYPQKELDGVVQVKLDTNLQTFKTVHKNDYVISLRSFQGGFEMSDYEGVCSPAYQVFYNREKINQKYFKYLFKSDGFISKINSLTVGIREGKNIQFKDFANSKLPYPSLTIQQKIATFLDKKCAAIDSAVEKELLLIEKLKSYKQSVITQAVTKGIRPNRKMKQSGIEWIGEIPQEWEVRRIKFSAKTRNEKYSELYGKLDYFGLENIESQSAKYIATDNIYDLEQSQICRKGDIAFGKLRPYLAKVYEIPKNECCSSEFVLFYDFKGINIYYKYLFLSHGFINIVDASTYGTKMPRANADFIKNLFIPLPPIDEQQEIASYLDKKCTAIESAISKKTSLIDKLKEYKKSLIYECVTGKRECCNF